MRDEAGQIIGTFEVTGSEEKVRYLKCSQEADSVTHSSSVGVSEVRLVWAAPLHWAGELRLHWTVVQDYNNYWTDLQSEPLTILDSTDRPLSNLSISPTSPTTTTTTSTPSTTTPAPVSAHRVYSGCDESKTCYGLPGECEDFQDCDLLSAWEVTTNHTVVELYRRVVDSESVYVALGLSSDDRMGEDLVTSCLSQDGEVSVASSWNTGHSNLPMVERVGQLRLVQGSLVDGELYCRLTLDNYLTGRPPLPGAETFHLSLDLESHHLLLAGGRAPALPPGSLTYHGPRLAQASSEKVQLSRLSHVHIKRDLLLKCHGVVMVIAWLGCAGSGIILARYYKETWSDGDCCGEAQWFLWHRALMFLVWAATIGGVVLIVLHTGGWPYSLAEVMTNPHPVLGLAALVLTFIQPLMALCRPTPVSPLRSRAMASSFRKYFGGYFGKVTLRPGLFLLPFRLVVWDSFGGHFASFRGG